MNPRKRSVESICASAGRDVESVTRPLMAPIYQGSVFEVKSLEQLDDIYAGVEDGFIYSELSNRAIDSSRHFLTPLLAHAAFTKSIF